MPVPRSKDVPFANHCSRHWSLSDKHEKRLATQTTSRKPAVVTASIIGVEILILRLPASDGRCSDRQPLFKVVVPSISSEDSLSPTESHSSLLNSQHGPRRPSSLGERAFSSWLEASVTMYVRVQDCAITSVKSIGRALRAGAEHENSYNCADRTRLGDFRTHFATDSRVGIPLGIKFKSIGGSAGTDSSRVSSFSRTTRVCWI